jgi:hypothetical protein
MNKDSNEALLNFRSLVHQPGIQLVHIWTAKIYLVEKYLGKNSLGYPYYYVKDSDGRLSTLDSTEVAPGDHRIVRVLAHWKNKLIATGKKLIVIGRDRDSSRLVCWFISDHSEYSSLANGVRKDTELLYYWTVGER